jgi:hypothetical protein
MTAETAFTLATAFGIITGGLWATIISEFDPEVTMEYISQVFIAWFCGFVIAISVLKFFFQ